MLTQIITNEQSLRKKCTNARKCGPNSEYGLVSRSESSWIIRNRTLRSVIRFYPLDCDTRISMLFECSLALTVFEPLPVLLRTQKQFTRFYSKFSVKLARFLVSKYASLLLRIKIVQRNHRHFFKDFKPKCAL